MANMRQGFQNVELIDQLIGHIKTHPFAMSRWDACICGHLARLKDKDIYSHDDPDRWGGEVLGISERNALALFCTNLDASRDDALRCLEILRDEGVVDWDRARTEVYDAMLERMRIEFEDDRMPIIDRLYERFQELCTAARSIT